MNCGKCHASFEKEGRDPLLLPACGHTLCRNCLRLFITHKGFMCPFCGKKQPSNMNLGDLHPNYAILQMIESLTDENGKNGGGGKKNRHRSKVRAGESKERNRERSVMKGSETECVEHEGVRLMYWCGPCGVAACGECVVEKHTGGGGGEGRKHQALKIDTAVKMRRSEVQEIVLMLVQTLEEAEKKQNNLAKSSPFVSAAKKLQGEMMMVMGKMRIVMSFLSRLIQESEEGDVGLQQLRLELNELIEKPLPSGATVGNVAEIMALLKHIKSIEEFRDGKVAKVLKELEVSGKENWMTHLITAATHTAVLNQRAAVLCKQLALCSDECHLDVVGGRGLLGSLTWEQNKFHLHCLRMPTGPRRSNSELARCHALKWQVLETQIEEVRQVFLDLAWGGPGQQGAAGKERLYFKLRCSESTTEASCRRFLHLLMGNENNSSLLGPLSRESLEALGRAILLGTHFQKEREDTESKSKEGGEGDKSTANSQPNARAVPPVIVDVGDLICIKGRQGKEGAEFWLETEGPQRFLVKPPTTCEVIGAALPAHKSLLAKLPHLKGVKVEDCGALLGPEKEGRESAHSSLTAPSARVSPSVHSPNAAKSNLNNLDDSFECAGW